MREIAFGSLLEIGIWYTTNSFIGNIQRLNTSIFHQQKMYSYAYLYSFTKGVKLILLIFWPTTVSNSLREIPFISHIFATEPQDSYLPIETHLPQIGLWIAMSLIPDRLIIRSKFLFVFFSELKCYRNTNNDAKKF